MAFFARDVFQQLVLQHRDFLGRGIGTVGQCGSADGERQSGERGGKQVQDFHGDHLMKWGSR